MKKAYLMTARSPLIQPHELVGVGFTFLMAVLQKIVLSKEIQQRMQQAGFIVAEREDWPSPAPLQETQPSGVAGFIAMKAEKFKAASLIPTRQNMEAGLNWFEEDLLTIA